MRKIAAILISALLIAACAVALTGCENTVIGKYYNRISDYRYAALRYSSEKFVIDAISGVRETPYELDGKSAENKTEYTLFTIKPYGDWAANMETVPLKVSVGGTDYTLEMVKHPFKGTYSSEISVALSGEEIGSLPVSVNGEDITLPACVEDGKDGEYALSLALDTVAEAMKGWNDYEIYLRVSENTITAAGGWYWYVAFVRGDGTSSVLINALSGEIAAVRG